VAVSTTIALTKLAKTVHPPAGSTAIIAVHMHPQWSFDLVPTLCGSLALVVIAALFINLIEHRRYPLYWL
jgi:CBS-domain-containing membrane protein